MKKRNMITAAMLAASMLLTACSGGGESTAPKSTNDTQPEAASPAEAKDGLTVAIQSDPSGLDPHMVTDRAAGIAIENLYNTLFTYTDKYGEVAPSLAKSYDVSEDGLTYTLQLQEGVLFHSGNTMTSEDVKYSLERIKDSGARASQVEKISSIETPDENTVVIQLESEYAPFLTYLANPLNAVVEKAAAEENDGSLTNIDAGTGPFKLVKWNEGSSVDMEAFGDYWEDGKPQVSTLQLKTITDATARATALRNGEIDMIIDAIDQETMVLNNAEGVVLETIPGTFWEYVGMNCESEQLQDPKVRQAIAYAIDRDAINTAVKMGNATVLKEANVPDTHDYYGGDDIYAARDTEKAKALLKRSEERRVGKECG